MCPARAQAQSTMWCSCQTSACKHPTTHRLVKFLRVFFFFVVVVFFFFLLLLFFFFFSFFLLLLQVATELIVAFLSTPKNRHLGGVFAYFWNPWSKKRCKYRWFLHVGSRKPRYLRCFFAFGNKNQGIYSIFCSRPSKNTGIYAVFTLLQDIVSIYKNNKKHCILRRFCFLWAAKNRPKIAPKRSQNGPKSTSRSTL